MGGLLLALLLSVAAPGLAQEGGTTEDLRDPGAEAYAACMHTARSDPENAIEGAREWQARAAEAGEDDAPARHCEAVAQLSLGQFEEAALRLEALAEDLSDEVGQLRPDLLAQAGQAWLLAGDAERAEAVQSAALEIRPDDVNLLLDRGLTRYQRGDGHEALEDMNRAAELAPDDAEVYIFRAGVFRLLNSPTLAEDDLARALQLSPDHPEALLERGNLHRLQGDAESARSDWERVIELDPESPAAEAAAYNLERIDEPLED